MDFIQEALGKRKHFNRRIYAILLALIPPLVCVALDPHLFDRALGVAGGIGESLLNGIYPVLLFFLIHKGQQGPMKMGKKLFLSALFLFSLFVMGIEIRHLL